MKYISFIVAATLLVAATSCQKEVNPILEDDQPVSTVKTRSFTAYVDDGEATRTMLNGNHVEWTKDEVIYVFDGQAPRRFVADEGGSIVTFSGEAADAETYYAVSPAAMMSGSTITATIPIFQTATQGSYDPKAAISVAVADAGDDSNIPTVLRFKNATAAVKFQIGNSDVTKIRLDAIGGESLAGKANISLGSNNDPNISMVADEAESCVILTPASGCFATGTDYVIAVAPGTYAGGFRLTLVKADGKFASFSNKTSQTLNRSDLMDFGTMLEVENWKEGTLTTLFTETFAGTNGTGGRDGVYSGEIGKSTIVYDNQNFWENPDRCGGAKQCLKFGTSDYNGSFYVEGLSISGKAVLSFSAAGWGSGTNQLHVEIEGATASGDTEITLSNGEWKNYTVNITNASGDVTISFSGKRGFLDDIQLDVNQVGGPIDPIGYTPSLSLTNVTPQNKKVGPTNGKASFDVESNVPWTISSDQSFVSLTVTDNHVGVDFSNMTEGESREVTITVTPSEGTFQAITFSQVTQTTQYIVSYSATLSDFNGKSSGTFYTKTSDNTVSKKWNFSRQNTFTGNASGYVQFGSKNDGAETLTFSTSEIGGLIKSVEINCAAYQGKHQIQIKVGDTVVKTENAQSWSNNTGGSIKWTGATTGNIEITATALTGARAFYLKTITVEYEQ